MCPRLGCEGLGDGDPHIGRCSVAGNARQHLPREGSHQIGEHMLITHVLQIHSSNGPMTSYLLH
jgi:hypothetical protein